MDKAPTISEQHLKAAEAAPQDKPKKEPYRPYPTPEEKAKQDAWPMSRHAVQDYYSFD
jgi:hypothetical protein